jgi:hypothetical protein
MAGRTPEIADGPANLLRTTPALIWKLIDEFGRDFERLDFYANEGGLQVVQKLSNTLMDVLWDENLTEAEQFFTLVALLRTAKVAQCIYLGPSTEAVGGLLQIDLPVYLV